AMELCSYWVQAHHLDLDFYDRYYPEGAYTETQANHMRLWHGDAVGAPAKGKRELAGARA
ncbi:MAG TPA: hypothetical protein VNM43_10255, partial [Dehalococcoidia bacterium]|nr:hypothetical protein [Dehalococcoidia bacterium]